MKQFLPQSDVLPELFYDMIFVEATYPILFSCVDSAGTPYICSCHCVNSKKAEWVIGPTTYNSLISLLKNKITIRDIFVDDHTDLFISVLLAGKNTPKIDKVEINKIDPLILPTPGYYMDSDPDEFLEEITELEQKEKRSAEYSVGTNLSMSVDVVLSMMKVQWNTIVKGVPSKAFELGKPEINTVRCYG